MPDDETIHLDRHGALLAPRDAEPFLTRTRGFTLVELLVGATLSAAVMAAVLSSYVYLAKNLVRLSNQQTLETEARRTLAYFARDVQMATGIDTTGVSPKVLPTATALTLNLPSPGTTASNYVTYSYNSAAGTLTRTPGIGTAQILLRNITSGGLTFNYYDTSGNPYTTYVNYLSGIKQLMLRFSTQTGNTSNGTRTLVYQAASNRLIVRNKAHLP